MMYWLVGIIGFIVGKLTGILHWHLHIDTHTVRYTRCRATKRIQTRQMYQ